MLETKHKLFPTTFPPIHRRKLTTLQVNLGYLCNQSCIHCHVNAGPSRTELMSLETIHQVIELIKNQGIIRLDLTGGAPELNPHFQYLVSRVRSMGVEVIDRCNLTVLQEPGQEGVAQFLADQKVTIVASLPCYLAENVDKQRGKGTFDRSILGLQELNSLGYGVNDNLVLNLVYNPQGASLPPSQEVLEADYKRFLQEKFQVSFNQLFTITNMPINRFGSYLESKKEFASYMALLHNAFQLDNVSDVMCRDLLSVDWLGYLYDCDFNQQLALPITLDQLEKPHVSDLMYRTLDKHSILIGEHCYGCTAGQGSSCGGALSDDISDNKYVREAT